jgi:hypothetical protein
MISNAKIEGFFNQLAAGQRPGANLGTAMSALMDIIRHQDERIDELEKAMKAMKDR